MINAAQIRAARGLLGLSQTRLSELASVSAATVKRVETASEICGSADTFWKIETALEDAGVEFIPADENKGPGVRLKHGGRGQEAKGPGRRRRRTG